MSKVALRPGPGRIAVQEIDLSKEVEVTTLSGEKLRLWVATHDSAEGKIARVVATAKPWVEVAYERVHNPEYDIGAVVVIGRWTGTKLKIDREEYIILNEEDVLAELLSGEPALIQATESEGDVIDEDEKAADKKFTENLIKGESLPL